MSRLAPKLAGVVLALALASPLAAEEPVLPVAVSVEPQAYLVEAVGASRVRVVVAVPPGSSPHVFDPTPSQVARLAAARVYVAAGVEVEAPLLPRLRAVHPDLVVVAPPEASAGRETHGDHAHDHVDPHFWLDPRLAAAQAEAIAATLGRLAPAHADSFQARADRTARRLQRLHEELAGILAPVRGRDMVVAHPAFGHLAAAYGLEQVAVEHQGHEPSPRRLTELLERVQAHGARVLFVQPQVAQPAARRLAQAAGIELVTLDPLARDLPQNLRAMARTIAAGLAPPGRRDGR